MTTTVRVELLGGFRVLADDEELDLPLGSRRLVAFLALQNAPLLRLYVAGVLWPDVSEKRAYANLRSALWRLRRTEREIVAAGDANVRLATGAAVDARAAAELAKAVLDGGVTDVPAEGMRCLSADLLPDWYDEWLELERHRLRQLCLHALEALADRLMAGGQFGLAAEAGLAALRDDRLRETANRTLMRTFLAEGNPAAAVRQYRSYRDLLHRELGLEPSAQMHALMESVPGGLTSSAS